MRFVGCAALLVALGTCGACRGQSPSASARQPRVAGGFYPADAQALRSAVRRLTAESPPVVQKAPVALICPHAGYVYSGRCAARAYKALNGADFRRVIVMGPSHWTAFKGVALPSYRVFRTPVGEVPIDTDTVEKLRSHSLFFVPSSGLGPEHSVEVQIPFLQVVLGSFSLVPLVVGAVREGQHEELAEALLPFTDDRTLVVASSDFTHYGARFGYVPFRQGIRSKIQELDFGAVRRILKLDSQGFSAYVRETGATICGRHPIGILLALLRRKGGVCGHFLSYMTSGDRTGAVSDSALLAEGSVSYAACAFVKGKEGTARVEVLDLLPHDKPLSSEAKTCLLRLARSTIERYLGGERHRDPHAYVDLKQLPDQVKFRAGAFVTLRKGKALRGCIGSIYPAQALWEAVVSNAINAAVNDYRFPPVKPEELKDIHIEISALTPPREIPGPEAFEVGRHGIIFEKSGRRAVFLPQVAPEQGWGREETLDHLAVKAGLGRDAWRSGARFWVFEAQVFGEEQH